MRKRDLGKLFNKITDRQRSNSCSLLSPWFLSYVLEQLILITSADAEYEAQETDFTQLENFSEISPKRTFEKKKKKKTKATMKKSHFLVCVAGSQPRVTPGSPAWAVLCLPDRKTAREALSKGWVTAAAWSPARKQTWWFFVLFYTTKEMSKNTCAVTSDSWFCEQLTCKYDSVNGRVCWRLGLLYTESLFFYLCKKLILLFLQS